MRRALGGLAMAATVLALAGCGGQAQPQAQTSAWEAEADQRHAAIASESSAAASASRAAAASSAAASASAAAASIAALPENQLRRALTDAGLTYRTDAATGICETLRAGGLPGDPDGGFPGRLPAEYLVVNEHVGSGDENSRAVMLVVQYLCPDQQGAVDQALTGKYPVAMRSKFPEGSYRVGTAIEPGTYRSAPATPGGVITDCYWERATADGTIIANNFASAATEITVTIRASDAVFTTSGCPAWQKVG